ncbi:hypothetical protein [Tenacibaculum aiptasiae]|uniref:hypothetical protein n=1 Tax=Tenacibaculum aiptasiae TaxID=426481 RepID=UPI00232EF2CF|nr:hypothetical protein [Tenacibaculum aiptasiae]
MEKLKSIPKSRINKIRKSENNGGLNFKELGKSENIEDYSDREITEMIYGIYKDSKHLLIDDLFLDLNEVSSTLCILERVSYLKKPTLDDYKTNHHNRISNIRTFYIKNYFLITGNKINGQKKHNITRYLHKIGFLNQGRNEFRGLYSISNDYKTMLNGKYPKDLFHPIKRYINGLFFNNDYKISDFKVKSEIKIHTGK